MELTCNRTRPAMDEGGFSIVELLVAVVILVFVSIALLQTAIVNIEFNTKNAIRDEGVRLAREMINEMRTGAMANAVDYNGVTETLNRRVRNMDVKYTVITTTAPVSAGNMRLDVTVEWKWKEEPFNVEMTTVRGL